MVFFFKVDYGFECYFEKFGICCLGIFFMGLEIEFILWEFVLWEWDVIRVF